MQATLTFTNRSQAETFATQWAFYSKRGYTLGAGVKNVNVTLNDVTANDKEWIDQRIAELNS